MKTRWLIVLVAVAVVTGTVRAENAAISISIATPAMEPGKEHSVVAFDRNSHFPVILTNTSDKPQRIIAEGNSWGDEALSFEVTDKSGKKSVARTVAHDYAKNMPHWWVVQPGESMVLDVYFADAEKWSGFPHPAGYGNSAVVTLRAVFEFGKAEGKPSPDGLWTGRVFSKPEQIVFYNRMPGK